MPPPHTPLACCCTCIPILPPAAYCTVVLPPACLPQAQLTHGYARLHVNATHFHIEAVDSSTGNVFDDTVLTNPRGSGSGNGSRISSSSSKGSSRQHLTLFGQRDDGMVALQARGGRRRCWLWPPRHRPA